MKKVWNLIKNILTGLLAVFAAGIMIFTVISLLILKQRDIFGYSLLVVRSDSMSTTDFKAGDLILVKKTGPEELKIGDIIAYSSAAKENYGEIVTHKIRNVVTDGKGKPAFVTYGTATGVNDDGIVAAENLVGKYQGSFPGLGRFFAFLKTVPGYLLFILLPFSLLIFFQGVRCVRLYREYREEKMENLFAQWEKRKEQEEENRQIQ